MSNLDPDLNEIEKLLDQDFQDIDAVLEDQDEILVATTEPQSAPEEICIENIAAGQSGFEQLLLHPQVEAFEQLVEKQHTLSSPQSTPFFLSMSQLSHEFRSVTYKRSVDGLYKKACTTLQHVYKNLVQGNLQEAKAIIPIVEHFKKILKVDLNLLINLATNRTNSKEYLYEHVVNVCLLSMAIAASLQYDEQQIYELALAALIHDVGMLLVPESIRFKKQILNKEELFEVNKHPILGMNIIDKLKYFPKIIPIACYQIHERENGVGYPRNRHANIIHPYAKIIQCADIFCALSSQRPYRNAATPYRATEQLVILAKNGFVNFDTVKAMLRFLSFFPVGGIVELSNGALAKVIAANNNSFTKPTVIVFTNNKEFLTAQDRYIIDLKKNTQCEIVKSFRFDIRKNIDIFDGF